MLYCAKCQLLTNCDCPKCGRHTKKLRTPKPADPVYLINCRLLAAGMIEPLLKENNIPYSMTGALGAALSTYLGCAFELYNFYVPYAAYQKAHQLIADVFAEDNEIMARLSHCCDE